jgi:hypothetical protein
MAPRITNYLRLKLPDLSDPAMIDVLNENFEVLDSVVGEGTAPTPLDLPSEPLALSAAPGNGRVTLTWDAPTAVGDGVLDYEVHRSVGTGAFALLQTGVLTTDFQDTTTGNAVLYTYRVRARNADGVGPWSQSAAATPVAPAQAPDVPRNLAASVAGPNVTLAWSPPVGVQADSYNVRRGTASGTYAEIATGIQATSYTDAGLAPGTYLYVVVGVNGVGTGGNSQEAVATVVSTEILSFDAEVAADTPYLYAKLDEDSGTSFADSSGNGRTGTLAGTGATLNVAGPLANGDTGALEVTGAARVTFGDVADFAGTAAFSVELVFKPTAVPNYSRLVSKEAYDSGPMPNLNNGWGLQLKPDYTAQFVRYLASAGDYAEGGTATPNVFNHLVGTYDGTTMKLYLAGVQVASVASALSITNHAQVLSLLAANTSAGVPFNWATGVASRFAVYSSALSAARVLAHYQAISGGGGGTTAPPPAAPAAPTGLSATAGDGQATLSWSAATDATSYAVRWGTASGVYTNEIQGLTNTSHIVTGLTNGTPYFFVVEGENAVGRGPASSQVGATPAAAGTPTLTLQAQINATPTSGTCAIQPGVYDAEDFGTASGQPVVINRAMTVTGGSNVQIYGSDVWTSWTGTGPWTSTLTVPAMAFNQGSNAVTTLPGAAWPEQVFVEDSTATDGWRELFQVDSSATTLAAGQFKIVNRSTDRRVQIGENPAGKRVRVTVKTMVFDVQASDVTIRGLSGPTSASPSAPRDGMKIRHAGPDYQRGMVNCRGSHARFTLKWVDAGYSSGPAVAMYHTVAGGNADFNLQGCYLHESAMGLDAGGLWNNSASGVPAWGFVIEDNEIAWCNRVGGSGGWHYAGIKITLWGGKAGYAAVMRRNHIHHTQVGAPGVWLDTYTPGWTIGGATEADANLLHHNEGYGFRNEINDALDQGSDAMTVRWNKTWNNRKAGIYVDVVKDITVRDNVSAWDGVAWDGTQNGINNATGIDVHWFTGRGDMAVVDNAGPLNNVVQDNKVVQTTGKFLVTWRQDGAASMADASNYGSGNQFAVTNASGAGTGGAIQAENSQPRFQVPSYTNQTTLAAYKATKYGGLGHTDDSYFSTIGDVQSFLTARGIPTTPNTT